MKECRVFTTLVPYKLAQCGSHLKCKWVRYETEPWQVQTRDGTMEGPDLSVFIDPVSKPDLSLTQSLHVFEFGII